MRRLLDFKPPKLNRAVVAYIRMIFPFFTKFVSRLSIKFCKPAGGIVEYLRDKPVVVFLNHPDRQDPMIIAALTKYIKQDVYTVVAREVFDWDQGRRGWLFQRVGCYSVNRGTVDVRSIRTTAQLLTEGKKVVVFPEAKITCDPGTVHELQKSFIHILLDVQSEISKGDPERSLYILPTAVNYNLDTDLESSFKQLKAIERKVGIDYHGSGNVLARVNDLTELVIRSLCEAYGVSYTEKTTAEQVEALILHICKRIAAFLDLKQDEDCPLDTRVHSLRNALSKRVDREASTSPYQQRLASFAKNPYRHFLEDLNRIERLLICHRILSLPPSPIMKCRLMDFLECETMGEMTAKGHQTASVNPGQLIRVADYVDEYKTSKTSAIDKLTERAKDYLQTALSEITQPQPQRVRTSNNSQHQQRQVVNHVEASDSV